MRDYDIIKNKKISYKNLTIGDIIGVKFNKNNYIEEHLFRIAKLNIDYNDKIWYRIRPYLSDSVIVNNDVTIPKIDVKINRIPDDCISNVYDE